MEPKIDAAKLTPETRAALVRFGKTAMRFYDRKYRKKEFITVGNERVLIERIVPRSVEMDYMEAKQALLEVPDQELRGALDRIDVAKLLDSLEGQSGQAHTEAYQKMVQLEKDLVQVASKLKLP
jgi:RecB family exonuclease